jgi:polyferredoxin
MTFSDINFAPARTVLRQFAAAWLVVFTGLACWHGLYHQHVVAGAVFAILAATVGPLGLWRPTAVRWVFVAAMLLTFPIGWLVSRVLLGTIYYGIFTPVALIFRLLGRDALRLRPRHDLPTYWLPKPQAANAASYFQQF